MNAVEARSAARFSIPSLIAIVAAIASFATGAFFGFVLAGVAILFGLLGILLSFGSRTRGGIASVLSVIAGLVGIVAAVIKLVMHAV